VITVEVAPLVVERTSVAGVTANEAMAKMGLVTPKGRMSMKYPPPATSGTVTGVDIVPPPSELADSVAPEQLVEEVLKQTVNVVVGFRLLAATVTEVATGPESTDSDMTTGVTVSGTVERNVEPKATLT
jgi:hypothetical protein